MQQAELLPATMPEIPTTTETKESGGELKLTEDQQKALESFFLFLCTPEERVWRLEGYSGCGKSTLVRTLLDQLPNFQKAAKLINTDYQPYAIELTATTNKAAENLGHITGFGVRTIHSLLGIRPSFDPTTRTTTMVPKSQDPQVFDTLLFIDEASFIDSQLLDYIFKLTRDCKIVFIGDPAQLAPVKTVGTPPVFAAGFPGAMLSEVVRQASTGTVNPIVDASTQFRHVVETGDWTKVRIKPDGQYIVHLSNQDFQNAVEREFTRPDWRYKDSKVLVWRNQRAIDFNHFIRERAKGDPHFQVGDYAVVNSFVTAHKASLKTDQMVEITHISEDTIEYDVLGNFFELDRSAKFFMPKSLADKNKRMKRASAEEDYGLVNIIENQWIDLRAAYASTVNKAQGSTYDRVFIDVADIGRCNSGDQIARMMYVGISRARHQVILTGDF